MAQATGAAALRATVTGAPTDIAAAANAAGVTLKPKDQVKALLDQNKHVIKQAMPKHMTPERFTRVAITSVTTTPALLECYVPTLIGSIIQCSQMGLEPNTVLGHAYIVPFWNSKKNRKDAQVVIGYKGLIDLARRSGQIVSIAAHAVYENDTFEFEYGLEEKLRHIPTEGERGDIKAFYAVAHMKDGGHAFEVMSAAAIDDIRDAAAQKNRAKRDNNGKLIITGPWKDHYEEMGRKTVIRRLAKYLPLSVEMATAVAMEDVSARGEAQNLDGVLDGEYTIAGEDAGGEGGGDAGAGETGGNTGQQQGSTGASAGSGGPDVPTWPEFKHRVAKATDAERLDFLRSVAKELPEENKDEAIELIGKRAGELANPTVGKK